MNKFCLVPLASAAILVSFPIFASEPVTATYDKGYLAFGTESESFRLWFDGRIMIDTGVVDSEKNEFVGNTEVRRARFAIKTKFAKAWAGEFDIDFAGNEASIKDMWVSYIGLDNFEFKVGNHKPFFSIAELTTSRWLTFMETSMITEVSAPGRRIGLSGSYSNHNVFAGVSLFGDAIGVDNRDPEGDGSEPGINEQYNYSLRALYRPFTNADATKFFHVGVNYLNLKPQSDEGGSMRFRTGLESSVFDYNILNTGRIKDASEQVSEGIEFAARFNKFMFQGEYLKSAIHNIKSNKPDVNTSGYYVEGSYMIFGSGRPYNLSDGEFGPVIPETSTGDLEVAIRYSTIDLNDEVAKVKGGEAKNITIGLNWYAHTNILVRLNHTMTSLDKNANGNGDYLGDDDINITGLRLQLMF